MSYLQNSHKDLFSANRFYYATDSAPLDFDLCPLGHFKLNSMFVYIDYLAINPPGSYHFITFFQVLQHFLNLALLFLLGPDKQEIENSESGDNHKKESRIQASALLALAAACGKQISYAH
jgi:hypothetical protein